MRARADSTLVAGSLPLAASRWRLVRMRSVALSRKACWMSQRITLKPERAKTWAMPEPMVPAPRTAMVWTGGVRVSDMGTLRWQLCIVAGQRSLPHLRSEMWGTQVSSFAAFAKAGGGGTRVSTIPHLRSEMWGTRRRFAEQVVEPKNLTADTRFSLDRKETRILRCAQDDNPKAAAPAEFYAALKMADSVGEADLPLREG